MKKLGTFILAIAFVLSMTTTVFAVEMPEWYELFDAELDFAQRYEYKDNDELMSLSGRNGKMYASGLKKRSDGSLYEMPLMYVDEHAGDCLDLSICGLCIVVNGQESAYSGSSILQNGITLVPSMVFEELGCNIVFEEEHYLTTIECDDTVLELLPNLVAMRKNRAEGHWVAITCARYIGDVLYVPARDVAEELGFTVDWNEKTNTVAIY